MPPIKAALENFRSSIDDHLIVVLILQKISDFELFSHRNLNCLHIGIDQKARN